MLSNFTGGGQIFLHNLRMLMQVLGRSIGASTLIGFFLAVTIICPDLSKIDFSASLTYQKARFVNDFDKEISKIREIINPRSTSNNSASNSPTTKNAKSITIINAYTKDGLYKSNILPSSVLANKKFFIPYNQTLSLLKKLLVMWLTFALLTFVIIFALWTRFGKATKDKKHLSGHTIKSAREVAIFLRKNNKASDLTIGNVPLVKDSEVKHIFITGSTGSGKTNCLHSLLPKIRQKGQPAVIIDTEGDMIARYYRPGKDIIINPFDKRTHHWNFWQEINSNRDLKKIATSFFPDSPPDSFDYDKKWTSWGRILFIGILEYLRTEESIAEEISAKKSKTIKKAEVVKEKATIENLYNLIHKETLASLSKKLKDTSVGSLISSSSDNNAAPHNIRINTLLATEWLEFIEDINETNQGNSFCFHDWISTLDNAKSSNYSNGNSNNYQWIFIACDGADSKILLPFISVLTDIALNTLISLGTNQNRRLWFVFDELAKLKYLPALQENITLLRKYGGCVLAATQSLNQLFSIYGRNSGNVMLGQFNTNIIFRILSADEARYVTKRIGEIEYLSHQKNTSYGVHEFRDGISYTEQEKRQDVIQPSDLAKLEEGECYMLLPILEVAICKTALKLVPKPQTIQPTFVYNHETEKLINKRQAKWQELNKTQQQCKRSDNTKKFRVKNKIEEKKQKINALIKGIASESPSQSKSKPQSPSTKSNNKHKTLNKDIKQENG